MLHWQCGPHLCSLLSVMAAFTSLLLNPKDPLGEILEGEMASLFSIVSGEGPVYHRPSGWIRGCGCSQAVVLELGGREVTYTGSPDLGLTDGSTGRQSPFRAIKCLYTMKRAGRMMSPRENKNQMTRLNLA